MKKTVSRIFVLVMAAAVAFTVVHFAVLGNNSPTDTAFTFALDGNNAILTGSTDALSGAVVLPESIGGHTVVGIGESAFKDCADVTAFFLPDTITSIGAYAFENCSGLLQAILPNGLVSIGEGAFWKCSSLVSVSVPASVTSIGSCAFYKCDAMESLIIPGASTPVKGAFNVALDIGQTIAVRNPVHQILDPITTTVYCYLDSAAYHDVLQDEYCDFALLDDCTLTSYSVRYVDESDIDVASPYQLTSQPAGIHVAAVATVVADNEELSYPDPSSQTIELTENANDNTIVFVYTVRTYTITFDVNGGDSKEPLVYATTDEYTLGTATRYGYTLLGWQVAEESTDAHYNWGDTHSIYQPTESVTEKYGDVTLKAVWQADGIKVTFDAQGGTADKDEMTVPFGETFGELAVATREGYSFDGWYTADGVKIESTTTVTALGDVTLYAHWSINKYNVTVTTDGNGTAAADLTEDVEYGTLVTLTAEPANGYAFSGWESDDVTVSGNTFSMPDKAVTVNASFAPVEYTITFDTDGGDDKEAITYIITDNTALGEPTKAGYSFISWKVVSSTGGNWGNTGAAYSAISTVNGKYGNVSFKATWRADSIKVTYDAQGGTASAESKNVIVGRTYGTLATATREGYTFEGWYTSADGGTKIEPTTTVTQTSAHTIYAYWTINKYSITLSTDGNGSVSADATEDVEYGTVVTLTTTPKPGYVFAQWVSSDVTVESNTFSMPDKAVRLRATFTPAEYTVTFDTDGGNAKDALVYKTTDETALGDATKAGYTLTGWQVSVPAAEGNYNWGNTQKIYAADQTVTGKYGDVTLKALWEGNTVTVFYDGMGGAADAENKAVKVGSAYGTLAGAVREGYTFDGWFTEKIGGSQITADSIVTATAGHTLFAHWTINKYNVNVTTDGNGTASADRTTDVEYGTLVTLTAEANEGYTFHTWESSDVVVNGSSFDMPDKAVTVKATFTANSYTIAFDANGVEQTMEPIGATYDADVELPACTFERAGFAFLGWALTADAETAAYADGETVKNLTANANETVTLYAVWKDIKVELIAKEGSTTVIDAERGFIYGLTLNMDIDTLVGEYLDVVGNGRIEVITENENLVGTGAIVELYDENTGKRAETYTVVIFGDLTGDGKITNADVAEIRSANLQVITYEPGTALLFAADLTGEGMITNADVTELRNANLQIVTLPQLPIEE